MEKTAYLIKSTDDEQIAVGKTSVSKLIQDLAHRTHNFQFLNHQVRIASDPHLFQNTKFPAKIKEAHVNFVQHILQTSFIRNKGKSTTVWTVN